MFGVSWLRLPSAARFSLRLTRELVVGVFLGVAFSLSSRSLALYLQSRRRERIDAAYPPRPIEIRSDEILNGVAGLIGDC